MDREKLVKEIIYFLKELKYIDWSVDENPIFMNIKNSLDDVIEVENYLVIFSKHLKRFTLYKKRYEIFLDELQKVRDILE